MMSAMTTNRGLMPVLLILGCAYTARAETTVLYDNTATDTGDTVLYSTGPYTTLGDQIHLLSPGLVSQAKVQIFNNGNAGTFDAELDFFQVGDPVGSLLGSSDLTGIGSAGADVIDMTFDLSTMLNVPQDIIFTVSIGNPTAGMDLGVDMFDPPTVGSSDNTFMIAESGGTYSQLPVNSENVYFQLSGTASVSAPEPSSLALLATCVPAMWFFQRLTVRRRRAGLDSRWQVHRLRVGARYRGARRRAPLLESACRRRSRRAHGLTSRLQPENVQFVEGRIAAVCTPERLFAQEGPECCVVAIGQAFP
jgi:hypothetical protein